MDIQDLLKTYDIKTTKEIPSGPIYICPNGDFIDLNSQDFITHAALDYYLLECGYDLSEENGFTYRIPIEFYNCVRCNDGKNFSGEVIIDLPKNRLTKEQYYSLAKWLDFAASKSSFVHVGSDILGIDYNTYFFDSIVSDEIIKRIKNYYLSGVLHEYYDPEDLNEIVRIDDYCIGDYIEQDIYQYKKLEHILDELGIDESDKLSKYSPMFILPNGKILDIEKANNQLGIDHEGYDTHQDFLYDIFKRLFQNKYGEDTLEFELDYGIDEYQLDVFSEQYNLIRINPGNNMVEGRFYCVLPRDNRPTEAQFRTLLEFFDMAQYELKDSILVVIGFSGAYKAYSLDNYTTDEIINKCKRYYSNHKLMESKKIHEESQQEYFKNSKIRDKDGNLLVCYHGTPTPGFKEFNPKEAKSQFGDYKFDKYNINYFTTNKKVAQGYTELGTDTGDNIYACYLNITNPYIVDNETAADMRRWNNIKDKNIRNKQLNAFEKFWKKYADKWLDETDLSSINRDLFYFNCKIIPSSERKDNSNYTTEDGYYDLYDLGNNTLFGNKSIKLYAYTLEELFDSYMYEEIRDALVGDFEEYPDDFSYTIDNLIKFVILMNEEDGTNYDGIIIPDIMDVGPKGSPFMDGSTTDVVTLISSNQIKLINNLNPTSSSNITENYAKLNDKIK